MTKNLQPDLDQARRHLHLLDPATDKFVFQAFDDFKNRKDPSLARTLYGTLDQLRGQLLNLNKRGAGVFVTVNYSANGGRKKEDISKFRVIFREADAPNIPGLPMEPHLALETSPGKRHEYLLIERTEDGQTWDDTMQGMVERFGSDPYAKDRARVLRLAGFYHQKDPARPHMVKIVHESGAPRYQLAEVAKVIRRSETAKPITTAPYQAGNGSAYGRKALDAEIELLAGAAEGSRNAQLNRAAFNTGQLVAGGELDRGEVEAALMVAAVNIGLHESEARQTIKSGLDSAAKSPRIAPQKNQALSRMKRREHAQDHSGAVAEVKRQVVPINIIDFLAREFPPRTNLLGPWLPSQGLVMAYAYRGIGKTHFALGVAYACASGGEYLGWQAPAPVGVMYLDGEMPGPVMQERLSAIVASNEKEPVAPFVLLTPDLQPEGMPRIDTEEGQALIDSTLTDEIKLIVVDNISTLSSARENEADGWTPVQEWALRQRANGRSVLFVHHSGKGGAQRGTSRREDVLDTVIALRRPVDYQPDQGAVFEIHFEKARGLHGDDVKPIEARLCTDDQGVMTWATRTVEDSTFDRVVELLNDGLSQKDIAAELNIHKSTVSRSVKKAEALGMVKVKNRATRQTPKGNADDWHEPAVGEL